MCFFAQLNATSLGDYGKGIWFRPKIWLSGVMSITGCAGVLQRPGWMPALTCSLSEEMLASWPVCLSRFSSCDTTTWPSSVKWQSSSSISVPDSTALETGDAQVTPVCTLSHLNVNTAFVLLETFGCFVNVVRNFSVLIFLVLSGKWKS